MTELQDVLVFASIMAPIILALMEVVKRTVTIKVNFLPLIALVLGVAVGFVAEPFTDLDVVLRMWSGALAGLSATGLFELVKQRKGETQGITKGVE